MATFDELDSFKRSLKREGRSDRTISSYAGDIEQFFNWLDTDEDVIPFSEISKDHISRFLDNLTNQGLSATTRNRKLSSMNMFLRYLTEEGTIKYNPATQVRAAKTPKRLPKPVSVGNIARITDIIETDFERTMLELLYGSGLRREELATARREYFDPEEEMLLVLGKGNKERLVPLSPEAIFYVQKLLLQHTSPWIFPSPKTKGAHISLRYINKRVSIWAKQAGVNSQKVTPHKFRHSFATDLINGGADLGAVSEFMGHASPATTKLYTQVSVQRSREVYRNAHPRARAGV